MFLKFKIQTHLKKSLQNETTENVSVYFGRGSSLYIVDHCAAHIWKGALIPCLLIAIPKTSKKECNLAAKANKNHPFWNSKLSRSL